MKWLKVLVPTDFSQYARNALDFAIGLSEFYNIEILLLHSINYNGNAEEPSRKIRKANSIENLCKESDFIKSKNPDIYVKILLDEGEVEHNIARVIDNEKIDFIVMGTKGKSGLEPTVFGSYASNVLIVSNCPVFTIPLTGHYKKINKILCLTEMSKSEFKAIKQSLAIASIFESEFIFYNVADNASKQSKKLENFRKKIKEISDFPLIKFETEQSANILESIENYTCKIQPDLIITLGKERSFWDRLFSKRITKNLCLYSKVPLLSFPETF